MRKTSKAEFNRFKKEFLRWMEILGLKGYMLYFYHKDLDGCYAEIEINESGAVAQVSYALEISVSDLLGGVTPENNAKHEALHLLLHKLCYLGAERWTGSSEIRNEAEKVVCVLEKTL